MLILYNGKARHSTNNLGRIFQLEKHQFVVFGRLVGRFSSESEGVGTVVKPWVAIRNDSLRTQFLYTVFVFAIAVLRASVVPLLFPPKKRIKPLLHF